MAISVLTVLSNLKALENGSNITQVRFAGSRFQISINASLACLLDLYLNIFSNYIFMNCSMSDQTFLTV